MFIFSRYYDVVYTVFPWRMLGGDWLCLSTTTFHMSRQGICILGMVDILCWHYTTCRCVSWGYIRVKEQAKLTPYPSVLDFEKLSLKLFPKIKLDELDFYCLCSLQKSIFKIDFCRLKIQFVELEFSNLLFFRNQVQMDRVLVCSSLGFTSHTRWILCSVLPP